MMVSKVDELFRILLPPEARAGVQVGEEYVVLPGDNGRLLLLPVSQMEQILTRTAGMWQGRDDLPDDGVAYVNQMRSGGRLADLGRVGHGS